MFTYEDLLISPLKKKVNGEHYFNVKGSSFIKTSNLYKTVDSIIGLGGNKGITSSDFGYTPRA
ncbi:MAG: hypothetical protein K8E24_013140 [Methanobacterium paludis]|nr:hypothetical protein [Methanobacterium paludis]